MSSDRVYFFIVIAWIGSFDMLWPIIINSSDIVPVLKLGLWKSQHFFSYSLKTLNRPANKPRLIYWILRKSKSTLEAICKCMPSSEAD
jgi:hypothetical protein